MQTMRDPKAMARTLKSALAADHIHKSHSECLEIVARQLGFADWNTANALLEGKSKPLPKLMLPQGWQVGGTQAQDYRIGIDSNAVGAPATIQSLHSGGEQTGFATLMQSVTAAPYLGKRLRLTAELRCEGCTGAATLWMRTNSDDGRVLILDNMEMRSSNGVLTGDMDWQQRQIVFDIPEGSRSLHYGFYLRGIGKCWARDFDIKTVSQAVPVTADRDELQPSPTNLGLSEKAG